MNTPSPFRRISLALLGLLAGSTLAAGTSAPAARPNVLFIAVDDLNDWVGAFSGNPQAVTPHLDRFAAKPGTVVFQRAYCPGPVCGPSRSALLSGFMPHRTGVYMNAQQMRRSPLVQTHATLPEYFAKHGYATLSTGKVFHMHPGDVEGTMDHGQWAFQVWEEARGDDRVDPARHTSRGRGLIEGQPDADPRFRAQGGAGFDWGPTLGGAEGTRDFLAARWAAERIAEQATDRPFFLALGIYLPHLPWFVPQEYFDRHPLEGVRIPEHRMDDLDDITTPDGKAAAEPTDDFLWVNRDPMLFRRAVQAYLAATTYADEAIGRVLEALERSPHADNTIVVIFGDHGFHLGEKLRFRKATLWAEATRAPLIIRAPGLGAGGSSPRVVNLIDLYPTLVDLAGLPERPEGAMDGRSLAPLLRDPQAAWPHPTLTISHQGEGAAVIGERWYYVRQQNGAEELYDMVADPMQWTNLVRSEAPEAQAAKAELLKHYPAEFAPGLKRNPRGPAYGGAPDETIRATRDLQTLR